MKICAYVQQRYAKETYKNECMDVRAFLGLRMVIDSIEREGYEVEWAGMDTVHLYDVVLVSLTANIDWWEFIKERIKWRKGNYKVFIGGAGVLHVTPFLDYGDYFFIGRGEETVKDVIKMLDGKSVDLPDSIIEKSTFSVDKIYHVEQAKDIYPYKIVSEGIKEFQEDAIGCNHKCFFCGYTWHRKFNSRFNYYQFGGGNTSQMEDKERAILDIEAGKGEVDFRLLRTTAIDGLSERLRFMVNKRITNDAIINFTRKMIESGHKGHIIRLFNIVGYPTETEVDWMEFKQVVEYADHLGGEKPQQEKWFYVLHITPFKPMPATPLACAPISYKNYRGLLPKVIGDGYKPRSLYRGKNLDMTDSAFIEGLPTQMLNAIADRGGENDVDNVRKLCQNKKFWSASTKQRQMTLEKYFDINYLFGEFNSKTLPSRYIRTYAGLEVFWDRPPWKEEYSIKPPKTE